MLQFWGGTLPRSTKDIDLSRATPVTVEQMLEIVRDCLSLEVEDDGLRFDIQSLRGEEIRIVSYHQGVRSTFTTRLGKAAIRLQIDVGFGDVITPRAMEIVYPSLLGLEEPRLLGYSPETAVAEKIQAMVALDVANSRMKDFYDVWLLASNREFSGDLLAEAMRATFARRSTSLPERIPTAFSSAFSEMPDKQMQWRAYLRKGRVVDKQPDLIDVTKLIASFATPIIEALRHDVAFENSWPPGGPWQNSEITR
jgi:hypothetical protein